MDDKIYEVKSLANSLKVIENGIKNAHPDYSAMTLRKKANKTFKEFSKEEFLILHNDYMQKFYRDGVIGEERSLRSKSYMLKDDFHDILGMFTIRLDALNISKLDVDLKEKIILHGKNIVDTSLIPCYLIEEIAKNSRYVDNPIGTDELVKSALIEIKKVQAIIGGDLVILNGICVPALLKKYHDIGFADLKSRYKPEGSKDSYQPMYMRMHS